MEKTKLKKIGTNTLMLYLLTFAKIIVPLITLPYLTRVLSVECYGVVSYIKAVNSYVQITIDFGFLYSAVKDIAKTTDDGEISKIVSDTIFARVLLAFVAFLVVVVLSFTIPILKNYKLYVYLAFLTPFLSCFLLDFFFRGIEKMHFVSIVFVTMKTISTILTIIFVKQDSQMILLPIFDAIGSLVAVVLTYVWALKLGLKPRVSSIKRAFSKIKKSFFYFTNTFAGQAFGALTTLVIGILIEDLQQIAFWSVSIQLVAGVQSLYVPISNGIYPHMVRTKDIFLVKKILLIFMPIVLLGTLFCYFFSPTILVLISGENYVMASDVFRRLLPVLILNFPVVILGLPTLGSVEKIKSINLATICGASTQICGLFVLSLLEIFTISNVAVLRSVSEVVMLVVLIVSVCKNRKLFNLTKNVSEV